MNFRLLLAALRARPRLFLLIVAATLLAALVVSLLLPRTYVARAALLVDSRDEQSLRSSNAPPERERTGYMQTQVDILASPRVARRVVERLHLAETPASRAEFAASNAEGDIAAWLAERLLKQLKINTTQSSIIQLAVASPSAEFSAQAANAFAQAYVDTVLELRVEPSRQTTAWFDEQLQGLRENMADAERRLAEFQREHGIVTVDERNDVETIQLAELAHQSVRPGAAAGRSAEAPASPQASPGVQALEANRLRAEARLEELGAELGPRHPQYLRQQAEVDSLRARIDSESRRLAGLAAQGDARQRQQQARLQGEMDALRDKALRQAAARNQMATLSHDVAIARRIYDSAMQRYLTSSIESRASLTNVSILNPAQPPARPTHPRLELNLGLAAVAGLLLGLAAVYLLEHFDRRVRAPIDLAEELAVPLLATLGPWRPLPAPGNTAPPALSGPGSTT